MYKDLLQFIVTKLVANPEKVSITVEEADDNKELLKLKVAKDDMGKVIGKQGKMAKAIRTLMKSIALKEHKRINIEFLDN